MCMFVCMGRECVLCDVLFACACVMSEQVHVAFSYLLASHSCVVDPPTPGWFTFMMLPVIVVTVFKYLFTRLDFF